MSDVINIHSTRQSSGRIVAVASIKGGVGKTTLAANVVGWLSAFGYSVMLVDSDEKANLGATEWISRALPQVPIQHIPDPGDLWDKLPNCRTQADYVVVDSPGSSELIRQLLLRADIAVIPAKAGRLEAPALVENVRLLRQAQDIRHGQPTGYVVLSQIGKGRKGEHRKLTRQMYALAKKLNIPLAATPLWLSELHPQAATDCKFIWQMGSQARDHANDMDELCYELFPETKPPLEQIG